MAALSGTAVGQPEDADAAALRQMTEGYIGAWKHADAQLIGSNFTPDGDFINPTGFHAVGRAAIAHFYDQAFDAGYRGSDAGFVARATRRIAPGVVVIDGEWRISGAHDPDGKLRPEERGIATAVLVKSGGEWRIAVLREQSSAATIQS
jgi:uncharacterized protein (TIGR02246 family)